MWGPEPINRGKMNIADEDELVNALKEMCDLEQQLENHKQGLVLRHDFNLHDAFNLVDKRYKGVVTIEELCVALK